jgi:aryl sulfotransferase
MNEIAEALGSAAAAEETEWPIKQRELRNHSMDSRRWDRFPFRPGDIVIASWAKSGTTWVQQILGQLIFGGAEDLPVIDMCPWIEQRYLPIERVHEIVEAQQHRRFMKTHLPADALTISPMARYIYVGRDGRDAVWSWHNHHRQMTPHAFQVLNSIPDRVGPPLEPACEDPRRFFHEWLDGNGYPIWPFWDNVRSWWNVRHLPNVLFVHFDQLKRDLPGQIRRIARFLEIDAPAESWPLITEHCTFDYMKSHGASLSPILGRAFERGADDFIYRGTNGRWREVLTVDDVHRYEAHMLKNLTAACAHWLCTGELDGQPT